MHTNKFWTKVYYYKTDVTRGKAFFNASELLITYCWFLFFKFHYIFLLLYPAHIEQRLIFQYLCIGFPLKPNYIFAVLGL